MQLQQGGLAGRELLQACTSRRAALLAPTLQQPHHHRVLPPMPASAFADSPTTNKAPITSFYYRDPSPWPSAADVNINIADQAPAYVDLIVAGGGPSGIAVAARVAAAGFSVCVVDPEPYGAWPNNYGVWVDEFQAMGLEDCLEVIWPKAKVWLNSGPDGEK